MAQAPDIIVVVLDCARYPDFPFGTDGHPVGPATESLLRESVLYPRAYSVAPWTIPAHRTLCSGNYFWNLPSFRSQGASDPSLAGALRASGYATLALSGNPILDEVSGISGEFDQVRVASWWEPYLRNGQWDPHNPGGRRAAAVPPGSRSAELVRNVQLLILASLRFPGGLEAGARILGRIRFPATDDRGVMSPWMEPAFDEWIRGIPADQPGLALVNFMDAHEPYYSASGLRDLWRAPRQDRLGWMLGSWSPKPGELTRLQSLYRSTFTTLDRRLGRLIESLRSAGRWDRTLFIVVGDHGQSFGEHGMVFHNQRVDEALLRVPMIVRFPDGAHGGAVARGRASLIDVAPTALRAAGSRPSFEADGIPLERLLDAERSSSLFAASTGIDPRCRHLVCADRLALLDGARVAAYDGEWKLVVGPSFPSHQLFEIDEDPRESNNVWTPGAAARYKALDRRAADVYRAVSGPLTDPKVDSTSRRLELWGY